MPKSVTSYRSVASANTNDDAADGREEEDEEELGEREAQAIRNAHRNAIQSRTTPVSPVDTRTHTSTRTSELDLRSRLPARLAVGESASLLAHADGRAGGYRAVQSVPSTPAFPLSRQHSQVNQHSLKLRNHSRRGSFGTRLARALGTDANQTEASDVEQSKSSLWMDDRMWYDQFTSTDWVHDSIADAFRIKELRSRKDFRGRLQSLFDGSQGWLIVAIIGIITAGFAYFIDITEAAIFDYKTGYCTTCWYHSKRKCCGGSSSCGDWARWSGLVDRGEDHDHLWTDYGAYIIWVVVLSLLACLATLQTKTTISSAISLSTLDENLGADLYHHTKDDNEGRKASMSPTRRFQEAARKPPVVYYPAAGSGVAEVKVILSGFVLHGYLGIKTLFWKTIGLILSVASGLSVGKEGPYVHVATCIGNIACRMFDKYRLNDGKRREVLSAAAAAGVAVAFGAPIGGVLFSLEEVSYYFPPKTMFRTFFCCIAAALSLKALNPYGTSKIVLFEVRYLVDWKFFEIIAFIILGILGGALGALFIKASRFWATTFRRVTVIKKYPIMEVLLVAIATGVVSFWNRYTRLPVAELLFELAAPCDAFSKTGSGLCPTRERIPDIIWYLLWAFIVKTLLTVVTFGIKVPAGIYVPSMVVGGLMGRIIGHTVQLLVLKYPNFGLFSACPSDGGPESCIVPGVYALVAAGATMCGVTRLSVTLAVILFELTGSLEHVLPFSLGVLTAKWTADALEPLSIYDLLTDMNAYPFLDSKARPVFTTDLGDITPHPRHHRYIDISQSPLVPARELRSKLEYLHMAGELDGGLPIVRDGILVGLIPAPDLEYALDNLQNEEGALCLMSPQAKWQGPGQGVQSPLNNPESSALMDDVDGASEADAEHPETEEEAEAQPLQRHTPTDPTDFTPYIDPAPVCLDICSPMDLVFECFVKLGLRYICVLKDGTFAGLVHKKAFVRYVKEVLDKER
jgi:chloride channel 3/4/5